MLTGSPPFTASDPVEWVHCHVARKPVPPHERSEHVPEPISRIVMKLLAKGAEERYDLRAFKRSLRGSRLRNRRRPQERISTTFHLGRLDIFLPRQEHPHVAKRIAYAGGVGTIEHICGWLDLFCTRIDGTP